MPRLGGARQDKRGIASIIGITPRTVHFHIANARQKLDASSLSQTVATAIKRGLLP
jgi:LuxR family transcriptional activator of conjugal transfer of Ti plasmids